MNSQIQKSSVYLLLSVLEKNFNSYGIISNDYLRIKNSLEFIGKKVVFSLPTPNELNSKIISEFSKTDLIFYFGISNQTIQKVKSSFNLLASISDNILWSLSEIDGQFGKNSNHPSDIIAIVEEYLPNYSVLYRSLLWNYTDRLPPKFISTLVLSTSTKILSQDHINPLDISHPVIDKQTDAEILIKKEKIRTGKLLKITIFIYKFFKFFGTNSFVQKLEAGFNNILEYRKKKL